MKPSSWLNRLAQIDFDLENDDAREEHITRVIVLLIGGTILGFTPTVLFILLSDREPFDWYGLGILAALIAPAAAAWILIQTGFWKIARHIPVIIFLALGFLGVYIYNIGTTFTLFFVLAFLLAGMYYSKRFQLVILTTVLLLTIIISWVTTQDFELTLTGGITFTGLMIGVWLLQLLGNNLLRKSLQHQKDLTNQLRIEVEERINAEKKMAETNQSLEKRVEERTAQLQSANQELRSIGYSIAHDLRAPIRAIIGLNEMVVSDHSHAINPEVQGYLEKAIAASNRMNTMLDGLLNLLNLNQVEIQTSDTDLSKMADEIFRQLVEENQIPKAAMQVRPTPPARADAGLMKQALSQLIVNSITYSKPDSPLFLEFGSQNSGKKPVYFLKDNGIGFDMAYADRVFAPFTSLDPNEEFSGRGIGLTIAKRIINLHGGTIWAESQKSQGATFYFSL